MSKSKSRTRGFVAAIIVLAIVSGVLAVGYIGSMTTLNTYATQLENGYQRSVYELISQVNSIENNLSKAIVSTGTSSREKLFNQIYTSCTKASEELSRLPINHESVNKTTNFINQMGGFSFYAENKLKNGKTLTQDDLDSLQGLYDTSVYIQKVLNDFSSDYSGKFSILSNSNDYENTENSFNSMFSNMQSQEVEYPTLIYDGPFSESQTKKDIKGLSKTEVSKEQAKSKIEEYYKDKDVEIVDEGETTGIFSTYNFKINKSNNETMYWQIAKRDGFVLSISSYASSGTDKISLQECEKKAEEFAKGLGVEVSAVWSTKVTGNAYVNLTPIVNNAIIYPDLIKVKVSCETGEVLAYEAQSYAFNHIEREGLTATITENEARAKVNSNLKIETQKLALIPIEYGEETLCYEYKCTQNNATFYVYINAKNGNEEQILKVIETTNGNLLM